MGTRFQAKKNDNQIKSSVFKQQKENKTKIHKK